MPIQFCSFVVKESKRFVLIFFFFISFSDEKYDTDVILNSRNSILKIR